MGRWSCFKVDNHISYQLFITSVTSHKLAQHCLKINGVMGSHREDSVEWGRGTLSFPGTISVPVYYGADYMRKRLTKAWALCACLGYSQHSPSNWRILLGKCGVGVILSTRPFCTFLQNMDDFYRSLVPLSGSFLFYLWSSGMAALWSLLLLPFWRVSAGAWWEICLLLIRFSLRMLIGFRSPWFSAVSHSLGLFWLFQRCLFLPYMCPCLAFLALRFRPLYPRSQLSLEPSCVLSTNTFATPLLAWSWVKLAGTFHLGHWRQDAQF